MSEIKAEEIKAEEIRTEAAEEKKPAKPEVRINGQLYRLRFDLWALEQIEEMFGGTKEAFQQLRGAGMTKAVRKMFGILVNCQRDYDGMPEIDADQVISRHLSLAKMTEISGAIQAAMEAGMKSETDGGEADDEPRDALAEAYNEKNA